MKKYYTFLLAFGFFGMTIPGYAYQFNDNLDLAGYIHMWITAYEQMEEIKGLEQDISRDPAVESTTGFSINKARITLKLNFFEELLWFNAGVRLEKEIAPLDLYTTLNIAPYFQLQFGQMKIPSTYEVLTNNLELDFIDRTQISRIITDYSLSRTVYRSSHFYGLRTYFRDLGIAVKGKVDISIGEFAYFLMASNGLGANLFIGGNTFREYLITNGFQFFYGARIELNNLLWDTVSLGGHINYNEHDNVSFNSGRFVYDFHRISASGDIIVRIPYTGVIITGMYAWGRVRDNIDLNDKWDLEYLGFEAKIMWNLNEMIYQVWKEYPQWLDDHIFEIGFRTDSYNTCTDYDVINEIFNLWIENYHFTFGFNYFYSKYIKLQLNYVMKKMYHPYEPGLDDDIFFINIQTSI